MNPLIRCLKDSRAFTLVELLIVSALVGIVMAAVLGLVVTTQRHTYTSEEVVDVQQNLRVALDFMSRDLRMAGFGVADDAFILEAPQRFGCEDDDDGDGGDGNCLDVSLRFRTLTATGAIARIDAEGGGLTTDPQVIEVTDKTSVTLLASGDPPQYVYLFRPSSRSLLLDQVLEVVSVDQNADPPTVTLTGFAEAAILRPGDLVVRVDNSNNNPLQPPNEIAYRLEKSGSGDDKQHDLIRVVKGADSDEEENSQRVARMITEAHFRYLLDDGGEVETVAGSDLERIRAIRITLTGATDATRTGSANYIPGQGDNVKTRALSTVVELRNR